MTSLAHATWLCPKLHRLPRGRHVDPDFSDLGQTLPHAHLPEYQTLGAPTGCWHFCGPSRSPGRMPSCPSDPSEPQLISAQRGRSPRPRQWKPCSLQDLPAPALPMGLRSIPDSGAPPPSHTQSWQETLTMTARLQAPVSSSGGRWLKWTVGQPQLGSQGEGATSELLREDSWAGPEAVRSSALPPSLVPASTV